MLLLNGDCLELLKEIPDASIDLIFCDLPYVDSKGKGQTSCAWNKSAIDLAQLWSELLRVKKLRTPLFFTTTTKFGVELINSSPKKCPFRYDIVWAKSASSGFLCAKKMPMRKHEMIYVFYEKLPFYDLSSHQHKFVKHKENTAKQKNSGAIHSGTIEGAGTYGQKRKTPLRRATKEEQFKYDPPLPVSVIKEKGCYGEKVPNSEAKYGQKCAQQYDPPLPVSVIKEDYNSVYNNTNKTTTPTTEHPVKGQTTGQPRYDPPLPTSVIKPEVSDAKEDKHTLYGEIKDHLPHTTGTYDPLLPTSMLEIKSTRGKHSTEKPVDLISWILKYYSKEGDIILDPTMGSGSCGVAAIQMNRDFVGIEKDEEIYQTAVQRIEG